VKILTVAVITTLLLFAVFCLQFWNTYRDLKITQTFYLRLQELAGIIIHYDEILTMSARMGAATGNLEWEERYRKYEPLLDATIKETIELSPEIFMSEAATATDVSNIELVAMENQAFDLIRQGQSEAAMAILFSKEYERHKAIYSQGMEEINSTIQERIKSALITQRQRSFLIVSFAVVTLAILLLAWFGIVRLVGVYVAERKKTEKTLRKAHNELEKKVDDRTADLQLSNEELKKAEKEIKEAKEFLESVIENSRDGIAITDAKGHILFVNNAILKMCTFSKEELVGQHSSVFTIDDKELRKRILKKTGELFENGVTSFESKHNAREGGYVDVECSNAMIKDSEGNYVAGVSIIRDITERKEAEKRIRVARDFLENIFKASADGILVTDHRRYITMVNQATTKMLGYSQDELLGKYLGELNPKGNNYEERAKEFVKELFEKGIITNHKHSWLRKDGSIIDCETSIVLLKDEEGNVSGSVGSVRDITERNHSEQKIIEYQNRLKALASELTLTEEKERRRFAGFLHDEIGQQLFATQLQLIQVKDSVSSTKSTKMLEDAINNVKMAMTNSRSLTFELSSPILYELGLEKALEWLAEQAHEKHGIMVTFKDDKREKPLDDDVKTFSYQAVRELLSNVAKHAQTKKASISIKKDNSNIRICVEDNGVGFNVQNKQFYDGKIEGFGLFSITERLEQLGGQLEIESQPNRGTQITLLVPLSSSV
jgi:PAS domain S-box-containing protein